jgi:hypothetical protein
MVLVNPVDASMCIFTCPELADDKSSLQRCMLDNN